MKQSLFPMNLSLPDGFPHKPPKDTPTRLNPLSVMLSLFGYCIPIVTTLAVIVFLRSGGSTIQSREPIQRLLMPPSVEIR